MFKVCLGALVVLLVGSQQLDARQGPLFLNADANGLVDARNFFLDGGALPVAAQDKVLVEVRKLEGIKSAEFVNGQLHLVRDPKVKWLKIAFGVRDIYRPYFSTPIYIWAETFGTGPA